MTNAPAGRSACQVASGGWHARPVQDLVGASEIAKLLGVTRQRVNQLAKEPSFPAPVAQLGLGAVWRTEDVLRWIDEHRPGSRPSPTDQ